MNIFAALTVAVIALAPWPVLIGSDLTQSDAASSDVTHGELVPPGGSDDGPPPALPTLALDYQASTLCSSAGAAGDPWTDDGTVGLDLARFGDPQCAVGGKSGTGWEVEFDGAGDAYATNGTNISQPWSFCLSASLDNVTGTRNIMDSQLSTARGALQSSANTMRLFAGGFLVGPSWGTSWRIVCGLVNGASSRLWVDGTEYTGDAGSHVFRPITIGSYFGVDNFFWEGPVERVSVVDGNEYSALIACAATDGCFVDF